MWNPIKFLFDAILEDLGQPVALQRLITKCPDLRVKLIEPERVIAADSVVKWHDWGKTWPQDYGVQNGRKYSYGEYGGSQIRRQEIENFVHCEITENWTCDIQDVSGLSASKSDLTAFFSLDDMVITKAPEMIDILDEERLTQNLSHCEIRILHNSNSGDYFACYQWDGRIFLINSGGSHHFAAARYIAARIGKPVPLKGKLYTYSIDPLAVDGLKRDFDMYATSDAPEVFCGFLEAMESFQATYYWLRLPPPHNHAQIILLPKNNRRSMQVSKALRKAKLLDAGEYFTNLLRQP